MPNTLSPPQRDWDRLRAMLHRWRELRDGIVEVTDVARQDELWRSPPRPYPGLRSFAQDEGNVFFAREEDTAALLTRLNQSNVTIVLGGSGSGKSSLVKAGLMPRLAAGTRVPGRPGSWYIAEMRPGEDPNAELIRGLCKGLLEPLLKSGTAADANARCPAAARALLGTTEAADPQTLLAAAPDILRGRLFPGADAVTLRSACIDPRALFALAIDGLDAYDAALSDGLRVGRPNLLLLMDQFEEAFRPGLDRLAVRNLCELLRVVADRQPPGLFIAVTMRSEEAHRATEAGLADVLNGSAFHVGPLTREEDRHSIICRPARTVFDDWLPDWRAALPAEAADTAPFSPEVVRRLMDESRRVLQGRFQGLDHLPLLQHALLRIWDVAAERWSRETGAPDLLIGEADLEQACGREQRFLVACLERHADAAHVAAFEAALIKLPEGDARARHAERLTFVALCSLARRDDRNNWARRFTNASRIAELASDGESSDVADRQAAAAYLRTLRAHGYLNQMQVLGGRSEDALFDVSHEALIRRWTRLRDDVLPRAEQIAADLYEVDRNLGRMAAADGPAAASEAGQPPRPGFRSAGRALRSWAAGLRQRLANVGMDTVESLSQYWRGARAAWQSIGDRSPVARLLAVIGWSLGWLSEAPELSATQTVPDRVRATLGAVLGREATIPRRLGAALLTDEAIQRRGTRGVAETANRDALELRNIARLRQMERPWRLATIYSQRLMARPLKVTVGVILLLVALASLSYSLNAARWVVQEERDRVRIGQDAARITLLAQDVRALIDSNLGGLSVAAYELIVALDWLETLGGQIANRSRELPSTQIRMRAEEWASIVRDYTASTALVDATVRRMLGSAAFRPASSESRVDEARRAGTACLHVTHESAPDESLTREIAGRRFGLHWYGVGRGWQVVVSRRDNAGFERAEDPDSLSGVLPPQQLPGPSDGAVCLSADGSILMIWPATVPNSAVQVPVFYGLRWYCDASNETHCQRWGVRIVPLDQPIMARQEWANPVEFDNRFGSARIPAGNRGIFLLPANHQDLHHGFVLIPDRPSHPLLIEFGADAAGATLVGAPRPDAAGDHRRCNASVASADGEIVCKANDGQGWSVAIRYRSPNRINPTIENQSHLSVNMRLLDADQLSVGEAEFYSGRIISVVRDEARQHMLIEDQHGIWRRAALQRDARRTQILRFDPKPGDLQQHLNSHPTPACQRYNCPGYLRSSLRRELPQPTERARQ